VYLNESDQNPFQERGGETMKSTVIFGIVLSLFAVSVTASAQQAPPVATPAPTEAAKAPAPAPAPSLMISRMEVCGNVMDRKPVDIGTTYPASQERVYCYLEFKDVKKETAVNVVWTLGQNEMGKVPLTIKPYAKFRTWSNKSINGMKGEWKVDVLDDKGAPLKSATFTVQ
jgi:hypothetical protein